MRKLTTDQFIKKCKTTHGDRYDYSEVVYGTAKDKIKIICRDHGLFESEAFSHSTGTNCPACSNVKKLDSDNFISRAQEVHKGRYDYSSVEYNGIKKKIKILCRDHGIFDQVADTHLYGSGCPKCAGRNLSSDEFLKKSKMFPHDYECLMETYTSVSKPMTFVCKIHGNFKMSGDKHLRGVGCPACGIISQTKTRTKDIVTFIKEATAIHGDRYDYSSVEYQQSLSVVNIICRKHGSFRQSPASHLSGRGCQRCSRKVSKGEAAWLDHLGINSRQVKISINDKLMEVDGFDEDTNTVYEYFGDYWHGNLNKFIATQINPNTKMTFQELYDRTQERCISIKKAGYNLVTIWESDWDKLAKSLK